MPSWRPTGQRATTPATSANGDKLAFTGPDGTVVIPAIATVSPIHRDGTLKVIVDRDGDFLLHYRRRGDIVPFSYVVDVPRRGLYELRSEVVTVVEGQSFFLTVNNAGPEMEVGLPYTVGMWKTSDPVVVSLVRGKNTLTFTRRPPQGIGTHSMWWYCANYDDPGCGGITMRSFSLTPL